MGWPFGGNLWENTGLWNRLHHDLCMASTGGFFAFVFILASVLDGVYGVFRHVRFYLVP